ncbi:MAG TPA: SprT family zinc-dependent metalloprotease [Candidatus Saccharimonadales bacterium]
MPSFIDTEFGEVTVRRSARARQVRLRIAPNGKLRASLPLFATVNLVKRFISSSRSDIRKLLESQASHTNYTQDMAIGKSHYLHVTNGPTTRISTESQIIRAVVKPDDSVASSRVQSLIKNEVIKAVRREAKAYLPRRLAYLAQQQGFSYRKVRFSHASSRWGSCSSNGTISLNIALMKLPHELIDYVLYHELCHTQFMNHSPGFWELVERCDPNYATHRRLLRQEHPYL